MTGLLPADEKFAVGAGKHVHSLLEVMPVTAAFLLTALHWDEARALTGRGRPEAHEWTG